jgi:Tfp pilus assembly protein PilF
VAINPKSSAAWDNLGIVLTDDKQFEAAIAAHQRAVELEPRAAMALANMSIPLRLAGRVDEAIAACRRSLELWPGNADGYNHLGVALAAKGDFAAAVAAYEQAIALGRPKAVYANLGIARAELGDIAGALACGNKAVEAEPDNAQSHFSLAITLLLSGDFQRGWAEYEWRWKCPEHTPPTPFQQPQWDGSPLNGRTLLVHCEQGLGDAIQFVRYVPQIAALNGRVILGCPLALRRLFADVPGIDRIAVTGDPAGPFDVHCPIVSLAYAFRTTAATIPATVPYLHPPAQAVEDWRQTLATALGPQTTRRLRVGLAWAGSPAHRNDQNRSLRLSQLSPIASAGHAVFFSLQKGPAAAQAAKPAVGMRVIDLTDKLSDLADTAAMIANLDLVICVDTSIAHLAGALGKPVWVLLPFNPDWRWLLGRDDSPWYPTMRLFRQKQIGAWDEVIQRVAEALRVVAPDDERLPHHPHRAPS